MDMTMKVKVAKTKVFSHDDENAGVYYCFLSILIF